MNPSNFKTFPNDSVFHHYESEEVARNIMIILARTGNTFRGLTWWEYRAERQADGHFTESEQKFLPTAIPKKQRHSLVRRGQVSNESNC